jgi:urease gamma subunit
MFTGVKMLSKEELISFQYHKGIQLEAVKQNGFAIQYIHNPDKEIQLEAVKENGHVLIYIYNPDKDVQLEAVKEDGQAIQYVYNPDKDVQMEAVKQNRYAIKYIHNPDRELCYIALGNCNNHNDLNDVIKNCNIEKYPEVYEYYVIKYTSLGE